MSKKFLLPDLGEGLPDATIVEWYVKEGDTIKLDDNLVSMETAKAVVDVPSPVSGKVLKLAGGAGDVIVTGSVLAEFEVDPSIAERQISRTAQRVAARDAEALRKKFPGFSKDLAREAQGRPLHRREPRDQERHPPSPNARGRQGNRRARDQIPRHPPQRKSHRH